MATKTTKKPKKTTKPEAPAPKFQMMGREDVEVDLLLDSPWQSRLEPKSDWLNELADSLRMGQTTPCLVRVLEDGQFELIAGHTRKRAAELAGLPTLRCELIQCDDETAQRLVLLENAKRKELSTLEKARAMAALVESYKQAGKSQRELAADVGISQSEVSSLARLTELPDPFDTLLHNESITKSAAEKLVPFLRHEVLAKKLFAEWQNYVSAMEPEQFSRDVDYEIRSAVKEAGLPIGQGLTVNGVVVSFEATKEQLKQLDVVQLSDGTTWALNQELWWELQKAAEAESAKAETTSNEEEEATETKPMTPEEAAAKKQQQAELLAGKIAMWKARIQRDELADWVTNDADERQLIALLVWCIFETTDWQAIGQMRDFLKEYLNAGGHKVDRSVERTELSWAVVEALAGVPPETSEQITIVRRCLSDWLRYVGKIGVGKLISPELIDRMWRMTGKDFAKMVWGPTACKDDVEEFLRLHSTAQLKELQQELGLKWSGTKDEMVSHFVDHYQRKPCPKSIIQAKVMDVPARMW
ncbi:ParB/RepB/Spo0J family partition protein [Planctopirus hydrillae]|uniref:ParB-like N-terminal domain-containing protein n=1 Tax=Planctopirus hydrillae TaxID=1841610 RepID=A0A1C3E499_9PLAN|nr:ParB/RepB/Spo0J family partition protein [Planctopirus hydrillae]ODA28057.1 hypothetical protein A6X21_14445 [Planctopirus hydrillae]